MRGGQRLPERKSQQHGSGMIEALIALLVISVGVLGVSRLQSVALANVNTSALRSMAAMHAASMAAAMHASAGFWASTATTVSITGNQVSGLSGTEDCASAICTPGQMAAYDVRQWASTLAATLPQDSASITCAGTPVSCRVQITWSEKSVAINDAASGAASSASYQVFVQP